MIGGTAIPRIQSTMSGPNQLGLWLLIPLGIVVSHIFSHETKNEDTRYKVHIRPLYLASCTLYLVAIAMTLCRAAWVGAAVMFAIALWPVVRSLSHHVRGALVALIVVAVFAVAALFPSVILRASSTRGHLEKPLEAIQMMIDHPLGKGLGTAGPASNRTSEACVLLRPEDDPSWAKARPNLCVFVGDTQVQPMDHTCNCPFLPENWYLQIGVELGWLGFALYLALVFLAFDQLRKVAGWKVASLQIQRAQPVTCNLQTCNIYLVFIGLSIATLFLHAFEDAGVSYTLWALCAVVLIKKERHASLAEY
jgi:hypothetical protein